MRGCVSLEIARASRSKARGAAAADARGRTLMATSRSRRVSRRGRPRPCRRRRSGWRSWNGPSWSPACRRARTDLTSALSGGVLRNPSAAGYACSSDSTSSRTRGSSACSLTNAWRASGATSTAAWNSVLTRSQSRVVGHDGPPSSRYSQVRAIAQSRFTVIAATSRTTAASSVVRPPKNRSSTRRRLAGVERGELLSEPRRGRGDRACPRLPARRRRRAIP